MKKILILSAIGLCAGFYFWPKETQKGVNTTVRTVTGTVTGAFQGGVAALKN
jgi:hypothetical protein